MKYQAANWHNPRNVSFLKTLGYRRASEIVTRRKLKSDRREGGENENDKTRAKAVRKVREIRIHRRSSIEFEEEL